MQVGTLLIKLTSSKVGEELACSWMPEDAVHVLALVVGADVHDMLVSALGEKFAESSLVELADSFNGCHFDFLFLNFLI